jgi:hypothetical protein
MFRRRNQTEKHKSPQLSPRLLSEPAKSEEGMEEGLEETMATREEEEEETLATRGKKERDKEIKTKRRHSGNWKMIVSYGLLPVCNIMIELISLLQTRTFKNKKVLQDPDLVNRNLKPVAFNRLKPPVGPKPS